MTQECTHPFKLLLSFPAKRLCSCAAIGSGLIRAEGDLPQLCQILLRSGSRVPEHGLVVGGRELEGVKHAILAFLQIPVSIEGIACLTAHEVLHKADLQAKHGMFAYYARDALRHIRKCNTWLLKCQ